MDRVKPSNDGFFSFEKPKMNNANHFGVRVALRPAITDDIAWIIQRNLRKQLHESFKQEIQESVYKYIIKRCNAAPEAPYNTPVHKHPYWRWTHYREVCFPNEIGCTCCMGGYPDTCCERKWAKHQECICSIDLANGYYCNCDSPHRRQYETVANCRDSEAPDYEFFQKRLSE